jgi:hypothetical protein
VFIQLSNKQRYMPAGACIYCGSRNSMGASPLSVEHIVPVGLGGELILPRASCENCASITIRNERFCLRKMLLEVRAQLGLPTGRPGNRPTEFQIGVFDEKSDGSLPANTDDVDYQWQTVSAAERPIALMLPRFVPPGVLWRRGLTDAYAFRSID